MLKMPLVDNCSGRPVKFEDSEVEIGVDIGSDRTILRKFIISQPFHKVKKKCLKLCIHHNWYCIRLHKMCRLRGTMSTFPTMSAIQLPKSLFATGDGNIPPFYMIFSFASSSTLYPCERVSEWVSRSFELQPSSVAWSLRACFLLAFQIGIISCEQYEPHGGWVAKGRQNWDDRAQEQVHQEDAQRRHVQVYIPLLST